METINNKSNWKENEIKRNSLMMIDYARHYIIKLHNNTDGKVQEMASEILSLLVDLEIETKCK